MEEYITFCIVDMHQKCFHLFSNKENEKIVSCETVDQFMKVLQVIKKNMNEDIIIYSRDMEL